MITIDLTLGDGFTPDQRTKLTKATGLIQASWNTTAFMLRVLSAKFTQTNDSSQKIYDTTMAVKDRHFKIELNTVPNGSETAATNTVTGVTTIQIAYLERATVFDLVNTLAHESSHTPEGGGYTHSYLCSRWIPWTRSRPWSVPYQLGDITQDIAMKLPTQTWENPVEVPATV